MSGCDLHQDIRCARRVIRANAWTSSLTRQSRQASIQACLCTASLTIMPVEMDVLPEPFYTFFVWVEPLLTVGGMLYAMYVLESTRLSHSDTKP